MNHPSATRFRSYEPSKADVDTLSAIPVPLPKTPNVLRWYNHIKSFTDKERLQFPNKKAEFSAAAGDSSKPAAAAADDDDDDDDVDLFGSDEEEVRVFPNCTYFVDRVERPRIGFSSIVDRRESMTVLHLSNYNCGLLINRIPIVAVIIGIILPRKTNH